MSMRLRDSTRILGGVERIWTDDDGSVVDEFIQDVEPILDMNKRHQCGDIPRSSLAAGEAFHKVASIPLVVAWKWKRELGVDVFNRDHQQRVEALLNDPDWAYLKTTSGHV